MPPRSANRRASARAKKSTPTSKQPNLESANLALDEIIPPPDSEIKEHQLPPSEVNAIKLEDELAEAKVQVEESGLPHPVIEAVYSETAAIDCSSGGLEGVAEDFVKEEMVEASADTVMEDGANADTARMEGIENGSVHEKNHNSNPEDLVQNAENVDEWNRENGVEVEHDLGEAISSGGCQPVLTPEINSAEVLAAAAENKCGSNSVLVGKEDCIGEVEGEESDDDDREEDNNGNQDDEDPSLSLDVSLTAAKKDKNLEIYVGRLDKETVEDDLIKIFGNFGELKSTRIVRNPTTKKSKGFAFVQFASADHAKNALSELKDGLEVKGKRVKISAASQENDTIYVGNICKTWSKEDVLGTLKQYGIEHFEEIHLPDDPKNDGKIKGFALLEFSTHSDAMTAFNRLRKPDAVFGCDKSAKVIFTQTPMHPTEEVLSQVKRVYLEGLTKAWNEGKVKEMCSQYGEIININICRSPSTKRKDFGFVTYTSREGALACVEGINRAHIREGEVEVKANIAKPQHKGRLQKQGFRGGFKVEKRSQVSPLKKEGDSAKEAESSKSKINAKSKQAKGKSKALSEEKKAALSNSSNVEQGIPKNDENLGTTSKSERANPKRKKPLNVEDHVDGGAEHTGSKRPSKKSRANGRGKQRNSSKNPNRGRHIRKGQNYSAESSKHRNPYAMPTGRAVSPAYHQGRAHPSSGSALKRHYIDMEPHAGYLKPVAVEGRSYSGYIEPGSATLSQSHSGYLEPAAGRQGQLQTRYLERTVLTQSHTGYIHNAHVESHAGYLQPAQAALVQRAHDPYCYGPRAGRYDGQGSSDSGYGGVVGSAVPASYVPNHTRYAGYEDGGIYYQKGGVYTPPRTYY